MFSISATQNFMVFIIHGSSVSFYILNSGVEDCGRVGVHWKVKGC